MKGLTKKQTAICAIILTNALWGTSAVVGKIGLNGIQTTHILSMLLMFVAVRYFVSGSLQLVVLGKSTTPTQFNLNLIRDLLITGLLVVVGHALLVNLTGFYLSSSLNIILTQLAIFTTIASGFIFLKEKITKLKLGVSIFGIIACIITTLPLNTEGTTLLGIFFILCKSLLHGGNNAYLKTCLKRNNSVKFGSQYCVVGGFLAFLFALGMNHSVVAEFVNLPVAVLICLGIQTFISCFSNLLYWKSIEVLEIGSLVLFGLIEILVGLLLSVLILRDTLTVGIIVGGLMLIATIVYYGYRLRTLE